MSFQNKRVDIVQFITGLERWLSCSREYDEMHDFCPILSFCGGIGGFKPYVLVYLGQLGQSGALSCETLETGIAHNKFLNFPTAHRKS